MRTSGVCPKCQGRKFWVIDTMKEHSNHSSAASLPVATLKKMGGLFASFAGTFQTFICSECGYTEWYAAGLDQLKEDKQQGIHFLDLEPKAGLR